MEPWAEVVIMNAGWGRIFQEDGREMTEVILAPEQIAEWQAMEERHHDEKAALRRRFQRAAS